MDNKSTGCLAESLLIFLVVVVAGLIYTLSRIENELLARLLAILVVCVSLSILAIGLGFGAALWRKAGHPPAQEKYIYHTKERTFDGRPQPAPQIMQLPAPTSAEFPALLEAAYAAGLGAARGAVRDETGAPTAAGLGDTWDGQMFDEFSREGVE